MNQFEEEEPTTLQDFFPTKEICAGDNSHIDSYRAALDANGIEGITFSEIDPDEFYPLLKTLQSGTDWFKNYLILCVGGTYRSAHARSIFSYLGLEVADGFVDLSRRVEGMSISQICSALRQDEASIGESGCLEFSGIKNEVCGFLIFADESTLGSLIRALSEIKLHEEDPTRLKLDVVFISGDEQLHREFKNEIIPPDEADLIPIGDNAI